MKHLTHTTLFCLIFLVGLVSCQSNKRVQTDYSIKVKPLIGYPKSEAGYELGVSASFAGLVSSELVMAGGCNFPDVPAVDGGAKKFYKGIYAVDISKPTTDSLSWRKVGELPVSAAYGVSIITDKGLICIGGSNENGPINHVFRISFQNGEAVVESLPSLPWGIDNMAGALLNNKLIIAGGTRNGIPSKQVLALDLNNLKGGWIPQTDYPGGYRTQPIAFAYQNSFCLWAGFAGASPKSKATLNTDGISLTDNEWTSLSTPVSSAGNEISFGGGTVVSLTNDSFLALGGVNKKVFLKALKREELLKNCSDEFVIDSLKNEGRLYMTQEPAWYQFNSHIMLYNAKDDEWHDLGSDSHLARAGAIAVKVKDNEIYLLGGELKPGIRTPTCISITLTN